MPQLVLGICGGAGSGKTTLAKLLSPLGWQRTRFSAGLKGMLAAFLLQQGVDNRTVWQMLDGDLKETPTLFFNHRTPRHAMQTLGTEWRNLIHRDLWVDAWRRHVETTPAHAKILVDDLRFQHEAQAIRAMGGKIVRVLRPSTIREITVAGAHISEVEALTLAVDAEILNDAGPEHMLDQLSSAMIQYF